MHWHAMHRKGRAARAAEARRRGRGLGLALLCAPWLLLCADGHARAQSDRPPLVDNDFNLDLVTGPVLGSGRIVGLGGAYTALAAGVEGAGWNPAAYASRVLWATDWLEWNGTANLIPSMVKDSDFDNNGESGFTYDDFLFGSIGFGVQLGELGFGALVNAQTYDIGERANLILVIANFGAGYMLLDGQLVIGAGVRTALMSMTDVESSDELVSFVGASPEAGAVWRPAGQRYRLGFAARAPVVSGEPDKLVAGGLTLPHQVRLPWEAQAGVAVQLGGRPLNRKWVNPHDEERRLRAAMLQRRAARMHEQWQLEQEAKRLRLSQERALPMLPGLTPAADVLAAPEGVPSDPTWREEEAERRWNEERELELALLESSREREREVRALSRRFVLLSADVIAVGPTPDGVGLESFLSQRRQRSGKDVTLGLRFGVEGEPIARWVQMRAGTYLEPSRFERVGYRVHGTAAADVRLFSWDFFGAVDEFTLRVGVSADVAERYLNAGFGVGLWH
jgi:hypothetical protein